MGTDRSLRYTEHHLKADDRPRTRYEYIVTGAREFPYDMLRYDRCWPMTSSDVAKMFPSAHGEPRSILMCSYTQPTLARWSSFGWSCGVEKLIG